MKFTVEMDEADLPMEQDSALHIFGAFPDTYSWWRFSYDWDLSAFPDGWTLTVHVTDPDDPEEVDELTKEVTHATLMDAMRRILSREVEASGPAHEACRDFVFNRDAADFDANTADEVLQVAVLGSVVYG